MDQRDLTKAEMPLGKTELKVYAEPLLTTLIQDVNTGIYRTGSLPKITAQLQNQARIVKWKTEELMQPATKEQILGHVVLLMQHYFERDLPPAVHDGMNRQWVGVLSREPEWVIDRAIIDWLSNATMSKRPLPGQIKKLCTKHSSKYRALIVQCQKIIQSPIEEERQATPEEQERDRLEVKRILEETMANLKAPTAAQQQNCHQV